MFCKIFLLNAKLYYLVFPIRILIKLSAFWSQSYLKTVLLTGLLLQLDFVFISFFLVVALFSPLITVKIHRSKWHFCRKLPIQPTLCLLIKDTKLLIRNLFPLHKWTHKNHNDLQQWNYEVSTVCTGREKLFLRKTGPYPSSTYPGEQRPCPHRCL